MRRRKHFDEAKPGGSGTSLNEAIRIHPVYRCATNTTALTPPRPDVGFLRQVNILGGPALTRQQFTTFVPQTFWGFHLFVGTPLGEYEPTRVLNPSANRWTIRPTINYSYTPDRGWTWLETYVTVAAFSANNAFQVGGASRLTQRPLFTVEGHASRNITARVWLSADAYYDVGGETSIDGVPQRNAADTLRLGVGMGARLWRGGDIVLNTEAVTS